MVSKLSAHLLSGYFSSCTSSDNSSDGSETSKKRELASITKESVHTTTAKDSASGYVADMENQSKSMSTVSPPSAIDLLLSKINHNTEAPGQSYVKRRKLDEVNYCAATAKKDMARGGIPIPSMNVRAAPALEKMGKIDMSGVKLVNAASVANSPFLTRKSHDSGFIYGAEINDMIQSCRVLYAEPSAALPSAEETDESTSSLTETEESYAANENQPRSSSRQSDARQNSFAPDLGARLVTLTESPYTVVHVNKAFTKLLGVSAAKILGRPLQDLLADDCLVETLKSSTEKRDLSKITRMQAFKGRASREANNVRCKVIVSPVATQQHIVTYASMEILTPSVDECIEFEHREGEPFIVTG